MEGQTLFYRTLPATARGPKTVASYLLLQMTCTSSLHYKPSWYQDQTTINKKTGLVKQVSGERLMKRGIDGRKVTMFVEKL